MKIRFARIRNLASRRGKGAAYGILLFLTFAVPRFDYAQDKPTIPGPTQQSKPASPPPNVSAGSIAATGTAAAKALQASAIRDVKVAREDDKLTVTVTTDGLLAPKEFILKEPPRLVLDFPNAENKVHFAALPVHAISVKQIRVQQFQSTPSLIARMVFDLEDGFGPHEITVDKNLVRLVFHKGQSKSNLAAAGPTGKPAPVLTDNPSKPKAPEAQPNRVASPKVPDTAGSDPKPRPAETTRTPTASATSTSSAAKPEGSLSRPELPKTSGAGNDPKPRPVTSAPAPVSAASPARAPAPAPAPAPAGVTAATAPATAKAPATPAQAPAPAPLVAALTPASFPAPPKMIASPNSRFSGQPLTLDLIDIPLVDFFRLMAEEGGINIVLDPEVRGNLSIKVVKVPWDQIFEAALLNHALDKQVEGSLVRIARKSTLQDEAKQQESLKKANLLAADLETRVKRLNYAKADSLMNALVDQKTVRGTIVMDERSNSLILTDIPSSLARLTQLIETLDVPQPQVEIEARIVSATRDFARDIGIQFGFVAGNLQRVTVGGPNTFGTIGGTRPSATPTSTFAAGNPFTGRGAAESSSTESASVSTGITSNEDGNLNVNLPATRAFGGAGISIGNIFDTFLLDAAITAGESKGLAKLISQPKVTAQNNSSAIITQGLRFPVQIVANNTVTIQFQNAALTLTVTPQITYEGNIVLDLKVENNTPDFARAVGNIPSIRTSESTTRVLVSDGGTTVIGGILIDDEATQEDKVPGLGSLPLVGHLFKRSAVSRSTQEVLFFVTPRIVK